MLLQDLLANYRTAVRARREAEAAADEYNAAALRANERSLAERLRPHLAPGYPYEVEPGEVLIRRKGWLVDRLDLTLAAGQPARRPMMAAADTPAPASTVTTVAAATPPVVNRLAIVLVAILVVAAGVGVDYYLRTRPSPPAPTPPAPTPAPLPPTPAAIAIAYPKDARPNTLVKLGLTGAVDDAEWDVILGSDATRMVDIVELVPAGTSAIFTGPAGTYRVAAWYEAGGKMGRAVAMVPLADPAPPEPPAPPAPPPAPTPTPAPTPAPTPPAPPAPPPAPPEPPAPIPAAGLRVLMIYESADLTKYPPAQSMVLYSQKLRTYLDTATPVANGVHEWRVWDKDVDVANESPIWQAAMKRPHPQLPWLVVSNGKTGYEGPMPADADAAQALIQKYEVKP